MLSFSLVPRSYKCCLSTLALFETNFVSLLKQLLFLLHDTCASARRHFLQRGTNFAAERDIICCRERKQLLKRGKDLLQRGSTFASERVPISLEKVNLLQWVTTFASERGNIYTKRDADYTMEKQHLLQKETTFASGR